MSENKANEGNIAEIVRLIEKVFNARNQKRARIFKEKVEPLKQGLKASHDNFLEILNDLIKMCLTLERSINTRENDISNEIAKIDQKLELLSDLRMENRSERRSIYEEARVQKKNLEVDFSKNKIVLSQPELELMTKFYDVICEYFQLRHNEYTHDISAFLMQLDEIAYASKSGNLSPDKTILRIERLKEECKRFEKRQERYWANLTSIFSRLKDKLV